MSKVKKTTTITICEDIIKEINDWRELCHKHDLMINRSDLIAILLLSGLERLELDTKQFTKEEIIDGLGVCLQGYYETYDLSVRRENGVE